jgi:S1-C subfamily serine protease
VERSDWDDGDDVDDPDVTDPRRPAAERAWRHPSEFGRTEPAPQRPLPNRRGVSPALTIAALVIGTVIGVGLLRLMLPTDESESAANPSRRVVAAATPDGPVTPATTVPDVTSANSPNSTEAGPTITAVSASTTSLPVTTLPEPPTTVLIEESGALAVPLGDDGHLVTTASAVAGQGSYFEVVLPDGTRNAASLIATGDGLAVLRVDRRSDDAEAMLTAPVLADDVELDDGAWVTVFGTTVLRAVLVTTDDGVALAGLGGSDAFSEGSPVVDDQGRLLGLCSRVQGTATLVRTSRATSLRGGLEQAWLGIASAPTEEPTPHGPTPRGVLVLDVVPSGPAAAAGVLPGDDILALDGQEVLSIMQLADLVTRRAPGDVVTLTLLRDGFPLELGVTLGVRPHAT